MAVLVVAIVALVAPDEKDKTDAAQSSPAVTPTSSATPSTTPSTSRSASSSSRGEPGPSLSLGGSSKSAGGERLPLVVLNNTTTNGLATMAANDFRDGGYTVTDVGNINNDILSTCAYYDPNVDGAKAAARALQREFPGIKRTAEKFAELPEGPIVVVLTSDYSGG